MSRTRKIEAEYADAIKFQDVIKELGFESVGEFVELVGGVMGMINVNDIDNAKKISEAFAIRIGYIIEKIGYVDRVIEKNKSMRDFYNEQQNKQKETSEVVNPEPAISIQLDPKLVDTLKANTGSIVAKSIGAGWYELSNGEKVRGKNNLPENVKIEE